jgi:hypothetical protein
MEHEDSFGKHCTVVRLDAMKRQTAQIDVPGFLPGEPLGAVVELMELLFLA